ncbi:MAG: hypothetical protein KDA24_11165, partial [Deltaproteobacteria bacterium]|nr:hypothetical protein [Deltaproteobacteria bacterium]
LAAHAQEESGDPSVDGPSETDEDEAAPGEETPPPAPPRVDSLGRPFPSPEVLERAKAQTIGGIVMAGVGGAALGTGLFLGSSVARGETEIGTPAETGVVLGVAFGSGVLLLAAGIPTASTGTFTTKQMNRTIKGAEKVPRTVANEMKYWDFYAQRQVGQAMTVGGGGAVLMGVVATGAAVAIVGTEFYKPEIWAAVGGTFGGGAGLIVAGILLQRDADQRMDALAKEVDPYYREASLPPRLRPFRIDSRDLIPLPTGMGISWAFRF